ncbi:MAG: hypothetical protein ABSF95_08000 [Verrucomicrobiota bacterium]|jgi:hypothetical protein
MKTLAKLGILGASVAFWAAPAGGSTSVYLTGVPDYNWAYGCMGTAAGNLMGFWDRHGFPDFYTGPVNGGVAPLNDSGANSGIVSLWASQAGHDGRPADQPGHVDDYWAGYENTGPDPYVIAQRPEHTPDCLGDFIGMSQLKWTNMANECDGNIDGFCFNYWDTNGDRRTNFVPDAAAGLPASDVQSGLRAWTQFRGYDCTVISQLVDFNPNIPAGTGFTFNDLEAEIDAGYPVLLSLQSYTEMSRTVNSTPHVNPHIHSMLAYGYYVNNGVSYARYRTSWASGNNSMHAWTSALWEANLPVRGVIVYHPLPRLRQWQYSLADGSLTLQWDGPAADLYDAVHGTTRRVHGYVVETSPSLSEPSFSAVSPVLTTNTYTVANYPSPAFFRVRLVNL